MVNDPDRAGRPADDRDPPTSADPTGPADPWLHDAETVMHRPVSGSDPGATQVNRPIDATVVGGTPADPQHWVARANVGPGGPRPSTPRAWEEDPAREDDPYGGRSWFTPVIMGVIGLVLLFAVGIGVFLIYRNNTDKPAQPQPSATAATAAPTTGAAPTTAAPTSAAPPSAEPTVSEPAIAVIPTLRGVPQQDATKQLKALGFIVNAVQVDDPTVDPGTVSRTDPAEGTSATTGSTITIFVARQPAKSPSASAVASASTR